MQLILQYLLIARIIFQLLTIQEFWEELSLRKREKHHRVPSLTRLEITRTETGNLTGSRFVSPRNDGGGGGDSPRREIELGAQQCPRKWTSHWIKSPRRLSHSASRQNFIIEPANSAGIHSRAKAAARNANVSAKRGDSFRELQFDSFKMSGYECKWNVQTVNTRKLAFRLKVWYFLANILTSREFCCSADGWPKL